MTIREQIAQAIEKYKDFAELKLLAGLLRCDEKMMLECSEGSLERFMMLQLVFGEGHPDVGLDPLQFIDKYQLRFKSFIDAQQW